ncbi:MAG TPA: SDR family oxidoreductase [Candidatus Dormibacteraeota bacterium]|nr:SDR family oxidoreductase [Candidatus Dormibacteraeota bacterium]
MATRVTVNMNGEESLALARGGQFSGGTSNGRLKGKIALITGGTTGIGFATAQLFQKEGAQVIVTGRNPQTVAEAQESLGRGVLVVESDVSNLTGTKALMKIVAEKFGRLDVLFANAGIVQFASVEQVDEGFFDRNFDVNVKGLFFTVKESLGLLSDGGAVLLNASVASRKGYAGASIYSATKAAVRSFGRTLAAELAPRRIRVVTISPGPVATALFSKLQMPKETVDAIAAGWAEGVALKRIGRPEEIANLALFLASDEASFITGTEVFADGGLAEL